MQHLQFTTQRSRWQWLPAFWFLVLVCAVSVPTALSQRVRQRPPARPAKKPDVAAPQPADKRQRAEQLQKQGEAYFYENQPEKAFATLEQAAQLYHDLQDRRGAAETLGKLGQFYRQAGQPRKALTYFLKLLPLWQTEQDKRKEAQTYNHLAAIYEDLGEPQAALTQYDNELKLRRQLNEKKDLATTLHNLALARRALGQAQKAWDAANEALRLSGDHGEQNFRALLHNTMGTIYEDLGNAAQALKSYQTAEQLAQAANNKAIRATTFSNLGGYYARQGNAKQSLEYQKQALQLMQETKNETSEALTLVKLGENYALQNDRNSALKYFNDALPLCIKIGNRNWEAHVRELIGKTQAASGNPQQALQYYRDSLQLTRDISQWTGEASTLYAMAQAERQLDRLTDAQSHMETALERIEAVRHKVTREDLRASFWASKQDVYEFYVDLLMARHKAEPGNGFDALALQAKERARARSLLDLLNEATANLRQGVDPDLLAHARELQAQINAKETKRLLLLASKKTEKTGADLNTDLKVLLEDYSQRQATIRKRSPQYDALMQVPTLKLTDIQQALDADTVLLEYFLSKDRSYVWAITTTTITSAELPAGKTIEELARNAYEQLIYRNQPGMQQTRELRNGGLSRHNQLKKSEKESDAEYEKIASKLGGIILTPIAAHLNKKRLLIVADGALQYLPFSALSKTSSAFTPLIVEHEVVSLPSVSVLLSLRRTRTVRPAPPGLVAVIADPVFNLEDQRLGEVFASNAARPGISPLLASAARETGMRFERLKFTEQESGDIEFRANKIAKGSNLIARGFDANLDTVIHPQLSQYRIVHFATHGLLNSQHPELSGLVFSLYDKSGKPREGFLRLHDVFNLKLNADLVVLSGCQTAMGKEVRGEGLIGLTRGFLYAGSSRVMASLWSIQDRPTADLMKQFYTHLLERRMTVSEALRVAQLEMWDNGQRAPYYWAAFTLQGDWQ